MLLTVGAGYEAFITRLLENVGGDVNAVEVSHGLEILPLGLVGHDHEHDSEATAEADEHQDEYLGVLGDGLECAAHEHEADEEGDHEHGACDPHVWMNPQNVIGWVNNIVAAFSAADPDNAAAYQTNGEAYITQLQALDAEIENIVTTIPEDRRILLTNHEFMGYFAEHYGFEVVATVLPGVNTGGEVDPQSLAALIALVQDENVPAIFAEVSANPQIADVIASESGVAVVTSLYSESLGAADSPASTYLDFMRYNAQTIANALTIAE
jgi:ABC-type Zn uptake system ZnuABC Zn-binding protein ZnuA